MWSFYKEHIKQERFKNIKKLRKSCIENEKNVIYKIKKYCERWDMNVDFVINNILNNDIVASFFIKNPKKQNIYEKLAVKKIKNIKGVKNVTNLPNNIKLFFVNGKIVNKRKNNVKSVDIKIEYKNKNIYVFHKFTDVEGGAQDNQHNDIKNCLKNCFGTNEYVVFICDGDYYQKFNRLKKLKEKESKNIKICTIYEIEEVLNGFEK